MTLVADRQGVAPVVLESDLEVGHHHDDGTLPQFNIQIDKPGRYAGVIVRGETPIDELETPMVTALPADVGRSVFVNAWTSRLPAGRYRIYVFFDRGPVTVRMEIPSLTGSRQLAMTRSVSLTHGPVPRLRDSSGVAVYGRSVDLDGPTLLSWDLGWNFGQTAGRAQTCVYDRDPGESAYGPGCPGGDAFGAADPGFVQREADEDAALISRGAAAALGANFSRSTTDAPKVDFYAAWIPLATWDALKVPDPPASPAAAAGTLTIGRSALVRDRRVRLTLRCTGSGACSGSLRIPGVRPRRYRLAAGSRRSTWLPLPARHRRARRLTVTVTPDAGDGERQTTISVETWRRG